MMNKLQLFIFLVCICMLAGCTEEEENSGIRLIEGTASGQTVFATKRLPMATYISRQTVLGLRR